MTKIRSALAAAASAFVLTACASTSLTQSEDAEAARRSLKIVGCSSANVSTAPLVREWDAFALGALGARECAVARLAGATDLSVGSDYQAVREDVLRLHGFYNRRAERQQTFMDMGAGISVIGAAGAFEGGISRSTREAWAIAAFVPVVISQFNAYEPTRELFHGGALGLQLITLRYDRYHRALTLLGEPQPAPDCTPHQAARDAIAGWSRVPARRAYDRGGLLQAEATRLHASCLELRAQAEAMEFTRDYADRLGPYLASEFAADVLQLDHAIVGKDRELRYSPSETLSALVASPLRAADMLLTGENTKAALDSLKTLIAFSGLNRNLATIDLPPLPPASAAIPPLSEGAAALAREGAPTAVRDQVATLQRLTEGLRERRLRQAFEMRLAGELTSAASADHLTFSYDVATTTTTVSLGPRPQTAPLASASTGAATRPGQ